MNLSDEEVGRLAEIVQDSLAANGSAATHGVRKRIVRAILAALPSRPSDSALRAEVRRVVGEMRQDMRPHQPVSQAWHAIMLKFSYRLSAALDATDQTAPAPTDQTPTVDWLRIVADLAERRQQCGLAAMLRMILDFADRSAMVPAGATRIEIVGKYFPHQYQEGVSANRALLIHVDELK